MYQESKIGNGDSSDNGDPARIYPDGNFLGEQPSDDAIAAEKAPAAEIIGPSTVEVETDNGKRKLQGQDLEVTVKRHADETRGLPERLEGGWQILDQLDLAPGMVYVYNYKLNKSKPARVAELLKLQPFKDGEPIPVIRTGGKLDSEFSPGFKGDKWSVIKSLGCGVYKVGRRNGEKTEVKLQLKSQLINAQIAELQQRIKNINESFGQVGPSVDSEAYQNVMKFTADITDWKNKLDESERLGKGSEDEVKRIMDANKKK